MRAHRNLLRAQNLLDRLRPPRTGLHRRVVGDNYNFATLNPADNSNHSSAGRSQSRSVFLPPSASAPFLILIVSDQQSNLLRSRTLSSSRSMRSRAVSFPWLCCVQSCLAHRRDAASLRVAATRRLIRADVIVDLSDAGASRRSRVLSSFIS